MQNHTSFEHRVQRTIAIRLARVARFGSLSLILFLVSLLSLPGCLGGKRSNLQVDRLKGRLMDGTPIEFSKIDAPQVVVNFYSPTCVPCIEELPSLNVLYRAAKERGIPVYMAVEGWPATHGLDLPDTAPREKIFAAIRDRMQKDVDRFHIELPVVIMDGEFHVKPEQGLISGTPETLYFRTHPFVVQYDFFGPLSTSHSEVELQTDSRFAFAVGMLGKTERVE